MTLIRTYIRIMGAIRLRVALYIRVSTEEQAQEGFSIRAQKNNLIDYCRVNDHEIVKIYIDDGYSAKDTKRPRLQELLKSAKNKEFDAVVVYKLDRFTRSVKDLYDLLEYLQSYGIDFISRQEKFDTSTALGRAMIGILGVFAQFERELIAERVRFGQEQKLKERKWPVGRKPFGYDKYGNQIPDEIEQIRMVRKLYMSGMSYQAVASYMLRNGYYRRGHEWTANTVALTLENPFYAGIIRYGSKLPNGKYPQRKRDLRVKVIEVDGTHEPVWTKDEYYEHLARMRRRSTGGYSRKVNYWFNGVLKCGRCGAAMFGRLTTKRSLKDGTIVRYPYYWCSRRKANKGCNMPMFRQSHVEHLIMEYIISLRVSNEKTRQQIEKLRKHEVQLKKEQEKLRRELDKIRSRIKKWQYAFAEDLISEDDLRQRMNEEYAAEQDILAKLEATSSTDKNSPTEQLFQLAELWPELDDIEKNETICAIFEQITLHTDEVAPKGVKNAFFPARVEVKFN